MTYRMKIRVLPFAMTLAMSPAFVASPTLAQPAADSDALTEMARKRFEEGVKLYDRGDFQHAQAAFLQAWALKKHPAVLLNLAQSELRAANHVAAARHFAQYLRDYPETPSDQQTSAREGLEEARKHTGLLDIVVSAEGAEVRVDGEPVGHSPLADPVDVEPGPHQVEVRLPGSPPMVQESTVGAGMANQVHFDIPSSAGAVPVPEARQVEPDAQDAESGRESFVSWAASDPVAWGTLGATGLGLGLGVTFAFMAGAAADDADSVTAQILAVASRDDDLLNYRGSDRRENPCADPVPNTSQTNYGPACDTLQDNLDLRDSRQTKMWLGLGLAAVGAAGTGVAYYLRTDPKQDEASSQGEPKSFTAVAPLWTPEVSGLGVSGTF